MKSVIAGFSTAVLLLSLGLSGAGCGGATDAEDKLADAAGGGDDSQEGDGNRSYTPSPADETAGDSDGTASAPNQGAPNPEPAADSSGAADASASPPDDGQPVDEETQDPDARNWVQLSTDDSTSMASAQMFKAGFAPRSLKAHEFINYYDPPWELFAEEPWGASGTLSDHIEFGIKAESTGAIEPTEGCEERGDCVGGVGAEVLFEMRAAPIDRSTRRSWNLLFCVDVSGSMSGSKIAFVRKALDKALGFLNPGDHVTLITFDSTAHDVFIDLEFSAHEQTIRGHFAALRSGSSTNMSAGLRRTYELAQSNYREEMLQRVILFSDGNANVGETDIQEFANLTRMNGQEGIYLSGVGVGNDYDWDRMDRLTDAGKGAHVFLPNELEVELIFGDYFQKLVEVAADQIAIELELPQGIRLAGFSGEEVSTDPDARLQNIILASGDDITFLAKFVAESEALFDEPAKLTVTLRPLATGEEVVFEQRLAQFRDLFTATANLFHRTRIVRDFANLAVGTAGVTAADIRAALSAYPNPDWGLTEIDGLLTERW